MKALLVTVSGVLLGLAASIVNAPWLSALGAVVTLAGAYAQYREAQPFELNFSNPSWQPSDIGYTLTIPSATHGKKSPTATVFEGSGLDFQEVGVAINVLANGAVAIFSSSPFTGKVTIK